MKLTRIGLGLRMAMQDIPNFVEGSEAFELDDQIRARLRQTASGRAGQRVSQFRRHLDLPQLQALAGAQGDNWWKDLLRLWRPSGSATADGLRLALRNNSINFYASGQSAAEVSVSRARPPHASIHAKYLADAFSSITKNLLERERGRCYPTLSEQGFSHSKADVAGLDYVPTSTIEQIVKRARAHSGAEKRFVEQIVALSSDVIDLEMGLPSLVDPTVGADGVWRRGKDGGAPRIDLVALEPSPFGPRVVFWEVKLAGDSRLVSRGTPEVISQLAKYEIFMSDPSRERDVREGYAATCRLLRKLLDMAEAVDPQGRTLSPLVLDVANNPERLTIDHKPRLLIYTEGKTTSSWPSHLAKLQRELVGRCFEAPAPFSLATLTNAGA